MPRWKRVCVGWLYPTGCRSVVEIISLYFGDVVCVVKCLKLDTEVVDVVIICPDFIGHESNCKFLYWEELPGCVV